MANEPHPTDWKDIPADEQEDLHPDSQELEPGRFGLTAQERKDLQRGSLRGLTNEQLKEIPVVPVGSRLRQGATYLDLNDPQRRPFTAMGGMVADETNYYVPKDDIDYTLWNRLIGVTNPERLDIADEQ
jgi:hypothetical protein